MAQYIKTEDGYKGLEESISAVTDNKMDKTNPTGTGSFSMNRKAGTVIGANSHAEGDDTTASGAYSHAEGSSTKASGIVSHAEGFWTKASGNYSHAEGYWTTASGEGSHTEGNQTTANGNYSHAEGTGTNKFSSVVTTTNPTTVDIINVWKNKKFSVAKGDYSHVEGKDNLALYSYSHAEGNGTIADGPSSHAEGNGTTAGGPSSHAEGYQTTASQSYSHAEGIKTTASGLSSHAEGGSTIASEQASHAEGGGTTASGYMSHAEGFNTTASGYYSHAEGDNTTASGVTTHAEGSSTRTSGESSHAEGGGTEANGNYSHAEGYNTKASGQYSHAEGSYTRASGEGSHVQGKCNIEDTSNTYADIIGNGTSNTARSNAATVDWNGNAWFAGDVYTGSTSGTNKDDGSKKLATEEYVSSSIAATSVLYTAQSLTEEQKAQARQNIGSFDIFDLPNLIKFNVKSKAIFGDKIVEGQVFALNDFQPIDINTADTETVEAWRTLYHTFSINNMQTLLGNTDMYMALAFLIDKNMFGENFYSNHIYSNCAWFGRNHEFMKFYSWAESDPAQKVLSGFIYDLEKSVGSFKYKVLTNEIEYFSYSYPLTASADTSTNGNKMMGQINMRADPTEPMQIATKQYIDNAIANIPATDLSNCVQTNKENILGDNGSIISNSSRGNSLTISNGVIEQKNSNQNTISLGDAKVVFSYDSDGSSSTKGNGTFAMYGKKGEEYFKFKATNGDVKVSGIATPTLSNDAVNKSYVDLQIANIEIPTVPTNVSAFTNDAGYLTEHQSLADYALKSEIPSPYSLPTASATELGGVKADSAEAVDTQPVRIGGDGKLYTAPGGTDISLGLTSAVVGQIIKVKAVDESGKPTEWEALDRVWKVAETYLLKDMTFPAAISIPQGKDSLLMLSGTDITPDKNTNVNITMGTAQQQSGYSSRWVFTQKMYAHGFGCGMFLELNYIRDGTAHFWMRQTGWERDQHKYQIVEDKPTGETDRFFYILSVDNSENINKNTTANIILYTRDAL